MAQSGAQRFAFVALLLLALPDVFTFQALLPLLRFAERNRQFCATAYTPLFFRNRFLSDSFQALIRFLVSIAFALQ